MFLLVISLVMLECYFLFNKCFMEENYIFDNISKIKDISGIIVYGWYDMICKIEVVESLYWVWLLS